MGRPDYHPAQRVAAWLSSEDVRAAITRVGMSRSDNAWRACCWDLDYEINKLADAALTPASAHPSPAPNDRPTMG